MSETLDRLLSMSSVTSVSADSSVSGSKAGIIKVRRQVFENTMNIIY